MNKQAISLVEVLVSVMLISVVIVSLLQIKENNLHFLDKSKDMVKYNSYISMIALDGNIKDGNVYLGDKINFNDDDIRKELKTVRIKVKNEDLEPILFSTDEYSLQINTSKVTLNIEDKIKKQFFRFKLN